MSETTNISMMAEMLSQEIFHWFKWEKTGAMNVNFDCEFPDKHNKKTHPSDVVFHYVDPYSGKRIYLNTDLKSYASGTLNRKNFTETLNSLAMAIESAEISDDWKTHFVIDDTESYFIHGLLFIHNHDNESTKELTEHLGKLDTKRIPIQKGQKLVVFSPEEINYFNTVVSDIKNYKAEELFNKKEDYSFYYPQIERKRRHIEWNAPATIEYLTAPWMIIRYKNAQNNDGYIVYYRGKGDTVDEFVYLIDTLCAYQLVSENHDIKIRFYNSHDKATIRFTQAKKQYLASWGMDSKKQLAFDKIEASSITNIVTVNFNEYEIGMDIRGQVNDN